MIQNLWDTAKAVNLRRLKSLSLFSGHNSMKLEINYEKKKKPFKKHKYVKTNQYATKQPMGH